MTAGRLAELASPAAPTAAVPRVRPATPRDLDAVVALRIALLREHPDHPIYGRLRPEIDRRARELFAAQLRARAETIFLAELAGEVVGIIRCVESIGSPLLEPARYGYVSSAYVRPDVRRRGVLRALLAEVEQWCRSRGIDQMRLHTLARTETADRAGHALGFAIVEQVRLRTIPALR
jgi:GNAT superfamily N-acetyltransferase